VGRFRTRIDHPPLAPGSRLVSGWRPDGFSQDLPRGLRIPLVNVRSVVARAERPDGALDGPGIEMPRALIPEAPRASAGATLVVHVLATRALVGGSRYGHRRPAP
jgi:hypothetical protein